MEALEKDEAVHPRKGEQKKTVMELQQLKRQKEKRYYIQLRKIDMVPRVNKPYVNMVFLIEQNLSLKSC